MSDPRVSVIMAVRDGEPYLSPSIESILGQSFAGLELIAVDDGSTDRTWEIITSFAGRDPRVVALRNEGNRGQPYTRNRALAIARGEYVAIQDADDLSLPGRLATQLSYLDEHPRVGTLACAVQELRDGEAPGEVVFRAAEDHAIRARLLISTCFPHSSLFARTELVRAIGGYRAEFTYAQDYDLVCRLGERAEIRCLPEVLVRYRVGHPGSISVHRVAQQYEMVRSISLEQLRRSYPGVEIDEEAHATFWWAIHGRRVALTPGRIAALAPLWRAMGTDLSVGSEIGRVLVEKVYHHPWWSSVLVLRLARAEFGAEVPWGGIARAWSAMAADRLLLEPLRKLGAAFPRRQPPGRELLRRGRARPTSSSGAP